MPDRQRALRQIDWKPIRALPPFCEMTDANFETLVSAAWVADTRLAEKTTLGELLTRYRDQVSPTKRGAHTERSRLGNGACGDHAIGTEKQRTCRPVAGWDCFVY